MGRRGSGAWLGLAAEVAALIEGKTGQERQRVIDRYAAEAGRNPIAVRRIVAAFDYVRLHADPAGVRAPVAAIEALQKIERLDGVRAAQLRFQVFAGVLPIRALIQEEREIVVKQADIPVAVSAMTLDDIRREFMADKRIDDRSRDVLSTPSDTAAWVGADADDREQSFALNTAPSWALLISPRLGISRLATCSFDGFIRAIGLASCLYDQVWVFASSKAEDEQIHEFFSTHGRDGSTPANIITKSASPKKDRTL